MLQVSKMLLTPRVKRAVDHLLMGTPAHQFAKMAIPGHAPWHSEYQMFCNCLGLKNHRSLMILDDTEKASLLEIASGPEFH